MSDNESSSSSEHGSARETSSDQNNQRFEKKLGKRLCYLLRYGAEKEGLKVTPGGYVELMELLRVPVMRRHQPFEVLKEVETSITETGKRRFEKKYENGSIYIRALYGRRMERNPNHDGTNVPRLMESCIAHISNSITKYDLQDFPDEYLVNTIIHRLRRNNRLNNKSLPSLLGPNLETLDLGGVMITPATLQLVGKRCPNLRILNLRETSYTLNDHIMENLLRKLPALESLNLSGCIHQTDRTIAALIKHCPNISTLNISHIPHITQDSILHLITTSTNLKHLDMFDNPNIKEEGREVLLEFQRQKGAMVVLDGLEIGLESVDQDDVSMTLPLASVGKYW